MYTEKKPKKGTNSKLNSTAKEIGNEINSVDKALSNCMAWNLLGEHLLILYCVDADAKKKRIRDERYKMRGGQN